MKRAFYVRTFLITLCLVFFVLGVCFGGSQSYRPTLKIKAGVLELHKGGVGAITGSSKNIDASWNYNVLAFQGLNLTKGYLAGDAKADINFEFVNPLGNPDYATHSINMNFPSSGLIDPANFYNDPKNNPSYWVLPVDMITDKSLAQYDVLLAPYNKDTDFQIASLVSNLKEWIQNGGILWYDCTNIANNSSYLLDITPIPYLYLAGGSSSVESYTNPVLDYPFVINKSDLRTMSRGGFFTGYPLGLEYSNFSLSYNDGNPSYSVINVGEGKIVFTFGNLSGCVGNTDYGYDKYRKMAYNLLYYALGSSPTRSGRLSQLLGDSATFTDSYSLVAKSKPIINANQVIYTIDSSGSYGVAIEGQNLTQVLSQGAAPKKGKSLSRPAVMGEDIVVYDVDGLIYVYTGIKYNADGSMNVNAPGAGWLNIYVPTNTDTPTHPNPEPLTDFANTNYAPLIRGNWIYYVDNKGRLHCVYAKDLAVKNGKLQSQHTWTTYSVGTGATYTTLITPPVISSRRDMFGAYVTEITWGIRNSDNESSPRKTQTCTVPVFVQDEVSFSQPMNSPDLSYMSANFKKYPATAQNRMSFYQFLNGSKAEKEFLDVLCYKNTNEPVRLKHYIEDDTPWDYKTNYDSSGKSSGDLCFNATVDKMFFSTTSDLVKKESSFKDIPFAQLKFSISYVPKYNQSIYSTVGTNPELFQRDIAESAGGLNYLYYLNIKDTSDAKETIPYILKDGVIYDYDRRTYDRKMQWSYFAHTGFKNLKTPVPGTEIFSHIEWNFPKGTPDVNKAQIKYMSSPVYVDGKVYIVCTATLNNLNRTAVICLESDFNPSIRVIDENGDPVHLFTRNTDGTNSNLTLRLCQPDPANADIAYNDLEFNPRDVAGVTIGDTGSGKLTISNIDFFKKDSGSKKKIPFGGLTTALPVFLSVGGKYLPIRLDTTTMVSSNYNDPLIGNNSVTVYDDASDSNKSKKLWLDLSEWNQINWYTVLPGNVLGKSVPMVMGDNVMLFADVMLDEYITTAAAVSSKLFNVSAKSNQRSGVKVLDDDVSVSSLPSSFKLNDEKRVGGMITQYIPTPAVGSNLIAISSTINNSNQMALFENNHTLVVDNNKVLEIDGGGEVTWRLISPEMWRGDSSLVDSFSLINPVKAKYLADRTVSGKGTIVVADAGKNALMFFDREGCIKNSNYDGLRRNWYFDRFVDRYGLLGSGQPNTLSNLSDFKIWTEELSNTQTRYHMTIADSGNKRILDLTFVTTDVDGIKKLSECDIDGNGNVYPYLNWVSFDAIQDKRYKYVSLDVSEPIKHDVFGEMRVIVAGISNFNAAERSGLKKSKGGSVIMYSYPLSAGNANQMGINDLRYGKSFDGIGKAGDSMGISYGPAGSTLKEIKGLKKVAIINKDSIDPYDFTDMKVVTCDDNGVIEYIVSRDGSNMNKPMAHWSNGSYPWSSKRFIPSAFFGVDNPVADELTAGSAYANGIASTGVTFPGRVRPFSGTFYNRITPALGYTVKPAYKNNWIPLKAPIIPMDVKILANGNWLVTNGYSGTLKNLYRNSYDGNTYVVEGNYGGEILEFEFKNIGTAADEKWYPVLMWSSNNFISYNVDDYIPGINDTGTYNASWFTDREEQIKDWLTILEDLDGFVYTDDISAVSNNQPSGEIGKSVGGWKMKNTPLQAPKSADR